MLIPEKHLQNKIGAFEAIGHYLPQFCGREGNGWWPVPMDAVSILTKSIDLVQREVKRHLIAGNRAAAKERAAIRMSLSQLAREGDVGYDHVELFLRDHPRVLTLSATDVIASPFYKYCIKLLSIEDPIALAGAIALEEKFGNWEIRMLCETNMIDPDSPYAREHLVVEDDHVKLANGLYDRLLRSDTLRDRALAGMLALDQLYLDIAKLAAAA